jgi:hypothetical protein
MRSGGKRTALALLVLACSVSACTSSEPPGQVEPSPAGDKTRVEPPPKPEGVVHELGPLLGGGVVERAPTPGRWASRVQFDQHRFITMEHTVGNNVSGTAVVRLGDDGLVRACFAGREVSTGDISHYASHDGKDHHNVTDHATIVGMTGSWKREGAGQTIVVVFDRMNWQTCEVDPTTEVFAQPPLRCFGFAANAKVPGDALLCTVPEALHWITRLSLLGGDSPRSGPWALRHDPSGHGVQPPVDAAAWLLLGAEPGLELRANDTDRDAEPLTIRVDKVADPVPPPAETR